MNRITAIGIDLAKNSFSVYGVNASGKPVVRRTLTRAGVIRFFANLSECLVGMEACASSEYWARTLESMGHTVRRIHPRYVKAYLLGAKNDVNDAAAICEAVQRPNMRFVPHKSPEQMDIQSIHRIRQGFVRSRTALINQIILSCYQMGFNNQLRWVRRARVRGEASKCCKPSTTASMTASRLLKSLFPQYFSRSSSQIRSCGFSSGEYGGKNANSMFAGMRKFFALCQPA